MYALAGFLRNSENKISYDHILFVESVEYNLQCVELNRYFSIADVVQALTESADGRKYWNKLKQRLKEEGSQLVTNCHQLKMRSTKDGKRYNTDVANTEQSKPVHSIRGRSV